MTGPDLKFHRIVWTRKGSDGWDYEYECVWSDGSRTRDDRLPAAALSGSVELHPVSRIYAKPPTAMSENPAVEAFLASVFNPVSVAAE